uniref:High-potential iron-sulfur protein n=2 Tax=Halochromatium salexigens TaxID=49447 RepID=HIP_HALSE|nr:RecName: Full=High-potential iron-sulfur protein; Short=HiPIP [Halochromatium salexigens]
QDLPHVDPATDPTAQALKYSEDAANADRAAAARPGKPPEEQFCHNCQFVLADSGEWRPCSLFPGKAVHETGWCASWTLKAG